MGASSRVLAVLGASDRRGGQDQVVWDGRGS